MRMHIIVVAKTLAITAFAIGMRALLQVWLGDGLPFIVAFPAAATAALLWGVWPGLFVAFACAAAAASPFFPPHGPVQQQPLQVGMFLLVSIIFCLICGVVRQRNRQPEALPVPVADDTPLSAWLRTVLLGAVLVPLTVFFAVAWWGLQTARTDAQTVASRATRLAADHAHGAFDVAARVARKTGEMSAGPDDEVRSQGEVLFQRLTDISTGLPAVVNINVWDAGGQSLGRSDALPDRSVGISDRDYFAEQRDRFATLAPFGGFSVSEVIIGRQTGRQLMNLTMRRPAEDGSFRGVVAVAVAPDFFRTYYRSLAMEDTRLANFMLVRSDGAVLARWPSLPDDVIRMPDASEVLQRMRRGETQGLVVRPGTTTRETRLVSFRQVPGYPMYVVAGFSESAVFARWAHFLMLLAAVLLPITVGLVYVSWVALRKTRQESITAAVLRDEIRRRSTAEKAMLESQRLETLAVLTGGVAHDFNNLLAIVNASLHLQTRKYPAQAAEPQIKAMLRAVQSGVRLTRQLLSFSRKQALSPERVVLQTWLPAAADLLRSTLGGAVELRYDVAADTATILVDTAELELALINLAVNARHALLKGGHLTIFAANANANANAADGAAGQVQVQVRDDGIGIPADVLPKVLEPFFTTRERGSGSGLGLTQVHALVTQSGGHLEIDSKPGFGTTVKLFFPAVEASDGSLAAAREVDCPLHGKLLLVEDNLELAASMASMLAATGLRIERAGSAEEALERLASAVVLPDVVLSDIAMPGEMDGIELAFRLRESYPGLPVLLATGYADKLEVATRGGLEVLAKPLSPQHLMRRLRELTRHD